MICTLGAGGKTGNRGRRARCAGRCAGGTSSGLLVVSEPPLLQAAGSCSGLHLLSILQEPAVPEGFRTRAGPGFGLSAETGARLA